MNFRPTLLAGARARSTDGRRDPALAPILLVLLGLVFAPIVGVHVALSSVNADASTAAPNVAAPTAPPAKRPVG